MSTGLVICYVCSREVHQDGSRSLMNGWRHCDDKSLICASQSKATGYDLRYPKDDSVIVGKFCGRDRAAAPAAPVSRAERRRIERELFGRRPGDLSFFGEE